MTDFNVRLRATPALPTWYPLIRGKQEERNHRGQQDECARVQQEAEEVAVAGGGGKPEAGGCRRKWQRPGELCQEGVDRFDQCDCHDGRDQKTIGQHAAQ